MLRDACGELVLRRLVVEHDESDENDDGCCSAGKEACGVAGERSLWPVAWRTDMRVKEHDVLGHPADDDEDDERGTDA